MTYAAFRNWASTRPEASIDDAVSKFPKAGFLQLLAWMSRFTAEREATS